jgi:thymidylate synthase
MTSENRSQAWRQAVRYIWNEGKIVYDKDERLKEVQNLVLQIQNPIKENKEIEELIPRKFIQEAKDFTFEKQPDEKLGYSYGERMYNFKGINQIQWVIGRLNKNSATKSATIGTLMPENDTKAEHIPCMNLVDFKKRDGKLNLTVVFRSHDYGKKALPNFIALGELLKKVSDATNSEVGILTCHSVSAHIYETEFETINRIINSPSKF